MFECGSQKQCPLPLSVRNVEQNATCVIFTWMMRTSKTFSLLQTEHSSTLLGVPGRPVPLLDHVSS